MIAQVTLYVKVEAGQIEAVDPDLLADAVVNVEIPDSNMSVVSVTSDVQEITEEG